MVYKITYNERLQLFIKTMITLEPKNKEVAWGREGFI